MDLTIRNTFKAFYVKMPCLSIKTWLIICECNVAPKNKIYLI